jgi:hypothetical protein
VLIFIDRFKKKKTNYSFPTETGKTLVTNWQRLNLLCDLVVFFLLFSHRLFQCFKIGKLYRVALEIRILKITSAVLERQCVIDVVDMLNEESVIRILIDFTFPNAPSRSLTMKDEDDNKGRELFSFL